MNAPRSKSVPAIRNLDRRTEQEDESTPFPTLLQEPANDSRVPSWVQELANARANRHSRASSVVSTRTRFSTTTFDDARSIDIQAGAHTFRISRYGDRVTDTTAPPPYSGPNNDELLIQRLDDIAPEDRDEQNDDRHVFHRPHHHHPFHHHHHYGELGRSHSRRVRIAMPDEDTTEFSNDGESAAAGTPSRVVTDEELRQIILDLPSRLQTALGIDPEKIQQHTSPAVDTVDKDVSGSKDTDMQHSGHAETGDSTERASEDRQVGTGQVRGILRNAPQNAPYHTGSDAPDHGKRRQFSFQSILWDTYKNAKGSQDSEEVDNEVGTSVDNSSDVLRPADNITIPPTVGDLNELSQVYNKVIRELDHEHRKQLHAKDKELDELRILLHEKDVVYRQQLKGKDFVIDDLKHRLDRLEEAMEQRIERAAHEVEDLWEMRWKEHSKQLLEKCGLIKPALQTYSTNTTQTDD